MPSHSLMPTPTTWRPARGPAIFDPDELRVGNNPRIGAYNDLLNEAATLHVRFRSFRAGDAFAFGEAQIAVLAPFAD